MLRNRNLLLLGLVSLLTDMSSQMIYPLLPAFLAGLGAGPVGIGFIEGCVESLAAIGKALSGRWSDRLRKRKPFIFAGYGLAAVAKASLFLAGSAGYVFVIRFADRLGKALRGPARDALLADSIDETQKGKSFGFHRAMDRLGAISGPAIAITMLYFLPNQIEVVLLAAGIPALLAIAFISPVKEPPLSEEPLVSGSTSKGFSPALKWFIAGQFIFSLGNSTNAFLLLKASELGFSLMMLPVLWMVYNAICSISAPLFGSWSDRVGRKPLIGLSICFYALMYLGFGLANDAWQLWILFAGYGIYYGM
ncbi:MAG: MFS transporter, partial [Bacteroidota bacterium]